MAIYCDQDIIKEIHNGNIVIEPFNREQLNNCSYNVTLSEFFFREAAPNQEDPIYFNPWYEEHVATQWIPGKAEIVHSSNKTKLGLKVGDKYVAVAPGESILAATQEFIGGRNHITTQIRGRSSTNRSRLAICPGAGWGDIGYVNRWSLLITNLSKHATVILPIGCSLAQIIFHRTGTPKQPYVGKYQSNPNLDVLKAFWTPKMILPQLYRESKTFSEDELR